MCLKDLRDEFIYDCECRHLAKGSLRNYKAATRFLLEYSKTVNRDEYGNGWEWRRRAEHQYLVQMDALKLMMEKGYQWGMLHAVAESNALLSKIEPLRFKELEDYIEEHLEEKIPWEIMRKELVERGCITNPKDRHKNQNMPELLVSERQNSVAVGYVIGMMVGTCAQ